MRFLFTLLCFGSILAITVVIALIDLAIKLLPLALVGLLLTALVKAFLARQRAKSGRGYVPASTVQVVAPYRSTSFGGDARHQAASIELRPTGRSHLIIDGEVIP